MNDIMMTFFGALLGFHLTLKQRKSTPTKHTYQRGGKNHAHIAVATLKANHGGDNLCQACQTCTKWSAPSSVSTKSSGLKDKSGNLLRTNAAIEPQVHSGVSLQAVNPAHCTHPHANHRPGALH